MQLSVPVITALAGTLMPGEAISCRLVLSSAAILGGIALVIRSRKFRVRLLTPSRHFIRRNMLGTWGKSLSLSALMALGKAQAPASYVCGLHSETEISGNGCDLLPGQSGRNGLHDVGGPMRYRIVAPVTIFPADQLRDEVGIVLSCQTRYRFASLLGSVTESTSGDIRTGNALVIDPLSSRYETPRPVIDGIRGQSIEVLGEG